MADSEKAVMEVCTTSWMEAFQSYLCCGGVQSSSQQDNEAFVLRQFQERSAMILGMNPKELRKMRSWCVYLWIQENHWALVLRPEGDAFQARIVDDFVHGAVHCYSAEVSSSRLFLVYEMIDTDGDPYIMLSAKPDFDGAISNVKQLGSVGSFSFEDIEHSIVSIVRECRHYTLIGSLSQSFAAELATRLGARHIVPDDGAIVDSAEKASAVVGAVGAAVGVAASAGALGSVASSSQPALIVPSVPIVLKSVAATATCVGLVGSLTVIGIVVGYRAICIAFRNDHTYTAAGPVFRITPGKLSTKVDLTQGIVIYPHSPRALCGYGGHIKTEKRCLDFSSDEPESEAAPASDKDSPVRKFTLEEPDSEPIAARRFTIEEPDRENLPDELTVALAAGGSRLAPWCSATSWEQPPWMQPSIELQTPR